ncbi:hypothetical protein A3Q32_03035 [Alcanivorax sp. KX64203]|nr:hypothetical protein A3Q32_03035 [Alcanivorax sp. KX64203]
MDGTMLAVVEDAGTEAWLDQALQGLGRLEKVTRSDLGRVLRMLEATGASVALVEMTDRDATQSMAVINALSNARPWVTVIAVTRIADQETVLQCMRSGARDCVIVGSDGAELRDRLRRHQLVRPSHWGEELQSKVRNLTMVTAVTPQIDSAFFAQNLAVSMAAQKPGQRILAIDMDARGDTVFHSDSKNNFDLGQLLSSPDTLDETLIDTALEEYRPGLRLLAGGPGSDFLGDRGADLFIALTRLMTMFDHIVLNVGAVSQSAWVRVIGVHVRELLLLANQEVPVVRAARDNIADWRPYLASNTDILVVIDGYEPAVPPKADELGDSVGAEIAATLPMEWKQRLEAINLAQPILESAPKSSYGKAVKALSARLMGSTKAESGKGWLKRA